MAGNKIIRMTAKPPGFGDTPDELEAGDFESALPLQHSHDYFEDDELGLYVGVWDTTTMTEAGGPYSCDEFMCVLEGEVGIRNNTSGTVDFVNAGEAFIIPRGYDCQWQQNGYLRKFYVIYEPPQLPVPSVPAVAGIIKPQVCTSPGQAGVKIDYRDMSDHFLVGSWSGGPLNCGPVSKPYHQFVYLLEGGLTLVDEWGEKHAFCAGDAFFAPQGSISRWQVDEKLSFHFVKIFTETAQA